MAPVRVVDLDWEGLDEPIGDLAGYVAVEGLVRRAGAPVGWVTVPVRAGRCAPEAVRRALDGLAPGPAPDTASVRAPHPQVTVAVCTRDRPVELDRCLDALERLAPPAPELLVIDNAPRTDATERLVATRHGRVRYVREPRPGLSWARNRAITEATGEIVAFTDDDVQVDQGWVWALADAFAGDPAVMAVTGLVVPAELETDAQVLFERYRSFGRGFVRLRAQAWPGTPVAARYGAAGSLGAGANMAFRRRLFEDIGRFDPCLGAGAVTRGGEDLDMFFRVLKAGHVLVYEPRALVRHWHRRSIDDLRGQMGDHGVSFFAYVTRCALAYPEERAGFARLAAWWLAKTVYRAVRPKAAPRGPMRRLALAELRGLARGPGRYRQARAIARQTAKGGWDLD